MDGGDPVVPMLVTGDRHLVDAIDPRDGHRMPPWKRNEQALVLGKLLQTDLSSFKARLQTITIRKELQVATQELYDRWWKFLKSDDVRQEFEHYVDEFEPESDEEDDPSSKATLRLHDGRSKDSEKNVEKNKLTFEEFVNWIKQATRAYFQEIGQKQPTLSFKFYSTFINEFLKQVPKECFNQEVDLNDSKFGNAIERHVRFVSQGINHKITMKELARGAQSDGRHYTKQEAVQGDCSGSGAGLHLFEANGADVKRDWHLHSAAERKKVNFYVGATLDETAEFVVGAVVEVYTSLSEAADSNWYCGTIVGVTPGTASAGKVAADVDEVRYDIRLTDSRLPKDGRTYTNCKEHPLKMRLLRRDSENRWVSLIGGTAFLPNFVFASAVPLWRAINGGSEPPFLHRRLKPGPEHAAGKWGRNFEPISEKQYTDIVRHNGITGADKCNVMLDSTVLRFLERIQAVFLSDDSVTTFLYERGLLAVAIPTPWLVTNERDYAHVFHSSQTRYFPDGRHVGEAEVASKRQEVLATGERIGRNADEGRVARDARMIRIFTQRSVEKVPPAERSEIHPAVAGGQNNK